MKWIEDQGISVSDFERKSDLSNTYLKKTEERGADITTKIADRIKEKNPTDYYKIFPEETPEMEVNESESLYKRMDENRTTASDLYLLKRLQIKNSEEPYLVPFVDIPAQAGYTKAYQHIDYIKTLKKFPILPDVDPHGAVWRYFQVDGDSMENPDAKMGEEEGIRKGDTILTSQVPREDWNQFTNLYTYVVVTDSELWIKDVDREMLIDENKWVLLSRNPSHEPFAVDVNDVKQLWVMRRHIRNRARKTRMYDLEQIKQKLKSK